MACSDWGSHDAYENTQLSRKVNHLTAMLCAVCQILEEKKIKFPKDVELAVRNGDEPLKLDVGYWWEHHKELDKMRKNEMAKQEQVKLDKKAALSKLTNKEKRLLGIDITLKDEEDDDKKK